MKFSSSYTLRHPSCIYASKEGVLNLEKFITQRLVSLRRDELFLLGYSVGCAGRSVKPEHLGSNPRYPTYEDGSHNAFSYNPREDTKEINFSLIRGGQSARLINGNATLFFKTTNKVLVPVVKLAKASDLSSEFSRFESGSGYRFFDPVFSKVAHLAIVKEQSRESIGCSQQVDSKRRKQIAISTEKIALPVNSEELRRTNCQQSIGKSLTGQEHPFYFPNTSIQQLN